MFVAASIPVTLCLVATALVLAGFAATAAIEARGRRAPRLRILCTRVQLAAIVTLGLTGLVLGASAAAAAPRWLFLLVIACPFWAVLLWATVKMRARDRA
jgi:hypothetical protein